MFENKFLMQFCFSPRSFAFAHFRSRLETCQGNKCSLRACLQKNWCLTSRSVFLISCCLWWKYGKHKINSEHLLWKAIKFRRWTPISVSSKINICLVYDCVLTLKQTQKYVLNYSLQQLEWPFLIKDYDTEINLIQWPIQPHLVPPAKKQHTQHNTSFCYLHPLPACVRCCHTISFRVYNSEAHCQHIRVRVCAIRGCRLLYFKSLFHHPL